MKSVRELADALRSAVISSIEAGDFKVVKVNNYDYVTMDVGGVEVCGFPLGIMRSMFLLGEQLNVSDDAIDLIQAAVADFADEAKKARIEELRGELAELEKVAV